MDYFENNERVMKKKYEKERSIAKSFLKIAPYYSNFPFGQKRALKKRLEAIDQTSLGFILEGLDVDTEYLEFRELVEDCYIDTLAANGIQRHFLKESLMNERENYRRMKTKEEVNLDTFNSGKHCDKFSRRKSGKKAKGKCFAKVRVKEISFS